MAKFLELHAPRPIVDELLAIQSDALRIVVADDQASTNYLSFLLYPNEGPLIGYLSAAHEATCQPIVERCARALGYEIMEV